MDHIAPPLQLIAHVKRSIETGHSTRTGVLSYVRAERSSFAKDVSKWLGHLDQGLPVGYLLVRHQSQYRRSLLELLERGMRGESIYVYLCQLEQETIEACQDEINRKLAKLPFLLLAPLLLLQFPAFLMLLFGPLLDNFFHSFGGG
ncbi:MAG: hypothetical protein JSU04_01650 [Bdellovibrionales bacterium]|nr:hypothetical protein [Bdellovibrionales bacterium]